MTQRQKEVLKEIFHLFDRDNDKIITIDEYIIILKCLHENTTDEIIQGIVIMIDPKSTGQYKFEDYFPYMEKIILKEKIDDAAMEAF